MVPSNCFVTDFVPQFLVSSPEVHHRQLQPEDKFIILACDGLWDVIDGELATRVVLQQFQEFGRGSEGAVRAAEELQSLAFRMGSSDNITVLVVTLK